MANHVANAETNELVRPGESRGLFSDDIKSQVMEVTQLANAAGHKRPVYHVHLDWPADTEMTDGMRADFWQRFEAEFGLENQPFASQIHVKNGREHEHRQYSLLRDDGHLVSMKSDFARREKLCRSFEFDHGMELVKGKHNRAVASALRADGRPDVADALDAQGLTAGQPGQSNLSPRQRQQMERTGIDPRQVGLSALAAFKASDSPRAFAAALQEQGLRLAQGDRGAVLVDASGSTHSLTRSIGTASKAEDGVRIRAAEVRTRLEGLDLPTVEQVRVEINAAAPGQGPQADQEDLRPVGQGGGPDLEGRDLQAIAMDIDVHSENAAEQAMNVWSQGMQQQVKSSAELDQKAAAATKKKINEAKEVGDVVRRNIEANRQQQKSMEFGPLQRSGPAGNSSEEQQRHQPSLSRAELGTTASSSRTAGGPERLRRQTASHSRRSGELASRSDGNGGKAGYSRANAARNLAESRAINRELNSPRFSGSFDRIRAEKARLDAAIKKPPQPARKPVGVTLAGKTYQDELSRLKDPVRAVLATARQGYNLRQIAHGLHTVWQDMPQAERERMVKETIKKALEVAHEEKERRERQERRQPGRKPGNQPSLRR
ncbi:relaxase/mobilization nuclease domain-containing protein [Thalassospira povalilytica]|uniref:relaxase/mobilization nuclease domain-containing protein n=1 Tax=Thalassospira povalilytica TaxID=732237 RepID=UPI001D17F3C4|nr:relaxase/mobilization nuclease domain-containing protein [Thalassospira povalilytica]MCC4240919.1 relaxase/mobilization nuclease domain-containing protein [Thalassospira povalilytica]